MPRTKHNKPSNKKWRTRRNIRNFLKSVSTVETPRELIKLEDLLNKENNK